MKVKVAHSCMTLCDTSPWNFLGQKTGVKAFPFSRGSSQPKDRTQVSCIAGGFFFYLLSHNGSPRVLEWVTYPLSRGSSNPGIACIAGRFFTNWAIRKALWKSKLRLKTWSAVKDSDITILTIVAFNMKNMWWSTHIVSEC